jgi:hypothetical protein
MTKGSSSEQGGRPPPQLSAAPRRSHASFEQLDEAGSFKFPASDNMVRDRSSEQLLRIIKSFAPSQPTQDIGQFAGRTDVLSNVITAIEEHRNHLVLFGGRGTGKTSLALAVSSNAKRAGYHCAYISCSRESDTDSIFRSVLAELPIRFDEHFDPRTPDIDPTLTFEALLPDGRISPQALIDVLGRIRGTRLLIVIDEFDRNESPTLPRDLTEIMKVVSDRAIPVQIVIVGVGDVVDNLVGEHASIARVLYAVRLTNMTDDQIRETLALASRTAGVLLEPEAVEAIVKISYGRPYIARLVGLKTAKMALLRGAPSAALEDFEAGTSELLGYLASAGFGQANRLVGGLPSYIPFFVAMLSCKRDSADRFTAQDVAALLEGQGEAIDSGKAIQRALDVVSSPEFGLLNVLKSSPAMYQFVDPRAELCVSILCGRIREGRQSAEIDYRDREKMRA